MMNNENSLRSWSSQEALFLTLAVGSALIVGWAVVRGNMLYLALLGAVLAVPVAVRWPVQVALGTYALLIPFDSIAVLTEGATGATLNKLVGVMAAAILLMTGVLSGRLVRPPRAALWWFLFILWGAMTAGWALDTATVLDRLPTSISLFLVYLVAVSMRVSEKDLSWVWALTILGGVVAAAYTSYLYGEALFYPKGARASLLVGERATDPNHLGTSFLLPLALAISAFVGTPGLLRKTVMVSAITVMGIGLYLTMSRGALLALLVMILVYLYRVRIDRRVLVPVGILIVLFFGMPELFLARVEEGANADDARLIIWAVGLEALNQYGMLGAGLSNFAFAYDQYGHGIYGLHRAPHNIYLGMWVELGIVGLFFMMAAIISQLRSLMAWRQNSMEQSHPYVLAIECACYGTLTSGFFLDIVWRKGFWLPWILLVLSLRAYDKPSPSLRSQ